MVKQVDSEVCRLGSNQGLPLPRCMALGKLVQRMGGISRDTQIQGLSGQCLWHPDPRLVLALPGCAHLGPMASIS